jgi:3-hydroxybutyryl-CoA dehydrogenase
MTDSKMGVVGGGLMGLGIATVLCRSGASVYLYEALRERRADIQERVANLLEDDGYARGLAKNLHVLDGIEEFPVDVEIIFEAALEKLPVKQEIFQQLAAHVSKKTVLASNTSVIPITAIASALKAEDKARVIGTHWWNPANLIPLVEVIKTQFSDQAVAEFAFDLLIRLGKKPVYVEKDVAGFIGNRLQNALWREAHALISDGVCSPETIDLVVKNSFGLRLPVFGPIENADMIGLDLTLDIHDVVLKDLSNSTTPLPALLERVRSQKLGAKSGQGFLDWDQAKKDQLQQRLNRHIRSMLATHQGMDDEA